MTKNVSFHHSIVTLETPLTSDSVLSAQLIILWTQVLRPALIAEMGPFHPVNSVGSTPQQGLTNTHVVNVQKTSSQSMKAQDVL